MAYLGPDNNYLFNRFGSGAQQPDSAAFLGSNVCRGPEPDPSVRVGPAIMHSALTRSTPLSEQMRIPEAQTTEPAPGLGQVALHDTDRDTV